SGKKTQGKGKIEIKINENVDDRLILFSIRCIVIYQKIYESSTLCGGEILFIIFSPTGKPYSFVHPSIQSTAKRFEILFIIFSPTGKPYSFVHPSIQSTAKRFLNANQPLNDTIYAPVEAFRKVRIN
ncbi:hypothetical protein Gogos_020754, partial [Gossypium gossypioides]|nr:hypothetical protein [Gossypium gossypioides]